MDKPKDKEALEGLPAIRATVRRFKRNASGVCVLAEPQSAPVVKDGASTSKGKESSKPSIAKKALPPKKGEGDCVKKTDVASNPNAEQKSNNDREDGGGEDKKVMKQLEKSEGKPLTGKPSATTDKTEARKVQGPRSGNQQEDRRGYTSRGRGGQRPQYDRKEFSGNQNQGSGPRRQWNNQDDSSAEHGMRSNNYGQRQYGTNYSRHMPGDQKQNYEQRPMNFSSTSASTDEANQSRQLNPSTGMENRPAYQRQYFGNQRGFRSDRGKHQYPQNNVSSGQEEKGDHARQVAKMFYALGNNEQHNQQHHPPRSGHMNPSEDNRRQNQYQRTYDNPRQNYGNQRGSWNQGRRGHPPRQGRGGFNRHDQIENRRFYSYDRRGGGEESSMHHQWNHKIRQEQSRIDRPAWFYKKSADSNFNEDELEYMAKWLDGTSKRNTKKPANDNSNKKPEGGGVDDDDDDWDDPKQPEGAVTGVNSNNGTNVSADTEEAKEPPITSPLETKPEERSVTFALESKPEEVPCTLTAEVSVSSVDTTDKTVIEVKDEVIPVPSSADTEVAKEPPVTSPLDTNPKERSVTFALESKPEEVPCTLTAEVSVSSVDTTDKTVIEVKDEVIPVPSSADTEIAKEPPITSPVETKPEERSVTSALESKPEEVPCTLTAEISVSSVDTTDKTVIEVTDEVIPVPSSADTEEAKEPPITSPLETKPEERSVTFALESKPEEVPCTLTAEVSVSSVDITDKTVIEVTDEVIPVPSSADTEIAKEPPITSPLETKPEEVPCTLTAEVSVSSADTTDKTVIEVTDEAIPVPSSADTEVAKEPPITSPLETKPEERSVTFALESKPEEVPCTLTAEVSVSSADKTVIEVTDEVIPVPSQAQTSVEVPENSICQEVEEIPVHVLDRGNIAGPGFLDIEEIFQELYENDSSK